MIKNTHYITLSVSPAIYGIAMSDSILKNYVLGGTHIMAGTISFNLPTATLGAKFDILYNASLSNYDAAGVRYLTIGGNILPNEYATKRCLIRCEVGTDILWKVLFLPDLSQTGIITSANILDGTILAADIASNAITTAKILDDNVTLAKIADIADSSILGNVSGGAASPAALTATQVRTLLAQNVTLSGNVTGTATETAGTGVTTVTTTIANNVITVAMCTNTVNTDLLTCTVSLETGALTVGSSYVGLKVPYACTVEEWGISVLSLVEATNDATMTLFNNAGVLMGSSSLTITGGTKPSTSAPASSSFFNSSSITSNNSLTAGQLISIRAQKNNAGGLLMANLKIKRT